MRSRSGRFAAAWLLGAVFAVLAMSHVPAAASWSGTADTVSGSKIIAMPVAKRPGPDAADLGSPVAAVLPAVVVLTLLAGVAAAALAGSPGRVRFGPRPHPGRGPPVALR